MDARKPSPRSPTRSSPAPSRAGRSLAGGGGDPLGAIAAGTFPATLYLEGPSEPLKAAILADLRHAWAAANPAAPRARVLRAAESSVEEILSAYLGTSLFAPRELTVVLEIEDLGRSEKRVAALAQGMRQSGGGSSLVLVESESETARKSLEPLRAASAARLVATPPSRTELLGWGKRRLEAEGIAADPGVLEAIADACEQDALAFFSELGRLTGFAGRGGRVTRADCDELLRPVVGAGLPDYLGAVAAGDPVMAARRLGRLLAAGESEGAILFALANLVGGALGGWARHREQSMALNRRSRPADLMRSMDAIYRAESAWKSGRADVIAVLEQATRAVAAR